MKPLIILVMDFQIMPHGHLCHAGRRRGSRTTTKCVEKRPCLERSVRKYTFDRAGFASRNAWQKVPLALLQNCPAVAAAVVYSDDDTPYAVARAYRK